MRIAFFMTCGLALALVSGPARADEFQEHVGRADALVRDERYREALVELRAAYAQRPSAVLLHRIAEVQERLGDTNAAIVAYEGVLTNAGSEDALRSSAKTHLASLLPRVADERPLPQAGVPVSFVGEDPKDRYAVMAAGSRCFTPCRLFLTPGAHRVLAMGDGNVDVTLAVPTSGGSVHIQHAMTPMLMSGIGLMTIGSVMMIAGNVAFITSFGGERGSANHAIVGISFGWAIGPLAHLVGIGLMAGSLAKLQDANTVRPVGFDLAPARGGTTARMTFSF
jgi:hypothetical protein